MLGLASLGCGARTLIGEGSDGSLGSVIGAGGSGTCTPPQDPNDQAFSPPTPVVGTWTGYFQGSNLPVSADAIKLTIDQASDGTNQIHIVFGSTPPPAPATVSDGPLPARPERRSMEHLESPVHRRVLRIPLMRCNCSGSGSSS